MFEDAGMIQSQRVKADGVTTRGWILRNQEQWSAAKPFEIADEIRAARDRAEVPKLASASDVMAEVTNK